MTEPLAIGDPRVPAVSVLLVTYGAWEWTERCLTALFRTTDVDYELICVDNASPDGTLDQLVSIPGVRLTRRPVNLGYGVAANLAALNARAPYLLLLNTDAIVQPGWLTPLKSVLDEEDDVAAVSPQLLHLDGLLQEAGSIIWSDGMTDCYGDGDDARLPEYRFRRDVDYASAACLLVRRSAFLDAGGFDPVYQPAYYEDTDLAMRWRSRGLRVVYQPLSKAVHKRWASSSGRAATEHLAALHRPVFVDRWRAIIGDRPPRQHHSGSRALTALRDAECGQRLLGVIDRAESAVSTDVINVLLGLGGPRGDWRRTLLCADAVAETPTAEALRSLGVEVIGAPRAADWLPSRTNHYTCIVAAGDLPSQVGDELRRTQPFAARVLLTASEIRQAPSSSWARWAQVVVSNSSAEPKQTSWASQARCVSLREAGAMSQIERITGLSP